MKELVITLMLWIGGSTGFPVPEPPTIAVKTLYEMNNILYGCDDLKINDKELYNSVCVIKDDIKSPNPAASILALYNHVTKEIYLPTYFNKDNVAHRAILLHELVHHLQYNSGYNKKVSCRGMLEEQAYDLMDVWLKENNAVMPVDLAIGPLLRFTITTCDYSGPVVPEEPESMDVSKDNVK